MGGQQEARERLKWTIFGPRRKSDTLQPDHKTQALSRSKENALSQSAIHEKAEIPARARPTRIRNPPSSSSDGDENSVNSKVRDLQIQDKPRPAGRKRSPDESADDDRAAKHQKSPDALPDSKLFQQGLMAKNANLQTNLMSSGNDTQPNAQTTQSPSGVRQGSGQSLNAQRGRAQQRDEEQTNRLDRSTSSTGAGAGAADRDEDPPEPDTSMLPQPNTKAITPEQLVNEVKGIYSGLVMVEKKCVEIVNQRSQAGLKLSHDQWQALIALHRTLLHEHHDFFLASQHPAASPPLKRLALKYAMPARMWRNGIHAFLELLRQQLPESYDHMLAFVYIAYSMMTLLLESVDSFEETWIECLGDLARYRMAIEEVDMRDRDIWSNVARMWYNKAADLSPNVGRIQHHLAVLARPNIVMQLFYYSKALVSVVPFPNARESVMLLFSPFLDKDKAETQCQKYTPLESSLVTAWGIAFTKRSISTYVLHTKTFLSSLDDHISRTTVRWKTQGPEVASSLIAGILDFGTQENYVWKLFRTHQETIKASMDIDLDQSGQEDDGSPDDGLIKEQLHREYWSSHKAKMKENHPGVPVPRRYDKTTSFRSPDEVAGHSLVTWHKATSIVAAKIGDKNTIPYLHLTLAFIWSLSFVPGALIYLESYVPWSSLVMFLNTLGRSGVYDAQVESAEFPETRSGVGRQLPEDFPIRGLVWATYYYPNGFFKGQVVDEDERQLELPSHAAPRALRCLWLGARIASLGRYLNYNVETKQFSMTEYAASLPAVAASDTFEDSSRSQTATMTDEEEFDAVMVNT